MNAFKTEQTEKKKEEGLWVTATFRGLRNQGWRQTGIELQTKVVYTILEN